MAINKQIITTHHHYIPRYTSSYSWKSTVTSTTTISDNGSKTTTSSTSATTTVPTTVITSSDHSSSTKTLPIHYNYNDTYSKYLNTSSEVKTSINYESYKNSRNMTTIPINIEPTKKTQTVTVPSIKKTEYNNKVETIYEQFHKDKNLLPVNRSSNLGINFNGSNFAILGIKFTTLEIEFKNLLNKLKYFKLSIFK
jgi:hypothetical protein